MGLDMYLYRKTYVQRRDHIKPEKQFSVSVQRGGKPFGGIDSGKVCYVTEQVGYWRKANAIHRWFVDNVQEGVDDCREAYVSREQLTELRDLCIHVLKAIELKAGKVHNGTKYKDGVKTQIYEDGEVIVDSRIAEDLLPTASGFFFGSKDYDQWYITDLRETVEIIEPLLIGEESGDFYYHSSW